MLWCSCCDLHTGLFPAKDLPWADPLGIPEQGKDPAHGETDVEFKATRATGGDESIKHKAGRFSNSVSQKDSRNQRPGTLIMCKKVKI